MFRIILSRFQELIRLLVFFQLVFQQISIFPCQLVKIKECITEFEKLKSNNKTSCEWLPGKNSLINIKCNKLEIKNSASYVNTFEVLSRTTPEATGQDLLNYVLKSLTKLSTENGITFEFLLHLYAVNSIDGFIENFKTASKLELSFNIKDEFHLKLVNLLYENKKQHRQNILFVPGIDIQLSKKFFATMTKLESIKISEAYAENLSTNMIGSLINLKELTIKCKYNNNIQKKPGIFEEEMFDGTPFLQSLEIINCGIDEFPANMLFNLDKIARLDISYNNLKKLPDDFFKSQSNLIYLYLIGNKLEALQPNIFQHLPNLVDLDCSNNHLRVFPSDLPLAHGSLQYLQWEKNMLTDDVTAALWKKFPHLKKADFKYNYITNLDLKFLNETSKARSYHHLKVDYRYNKVRELHTDNLSSLNLENYDGLFLDLSYNPIQCHPDPNMLRNIIANVIEYKKPLVKVNCELSDQQFAEIPLSSFFKTYCLGYGQIDHGRSCPKGCTCKFYYKEMVYSINCISSKLFDSQAHFELVNSTKLRVIMDLSGNSLDKLPVTKNIGYAAVTELIAVNNSLCQLNAINIPPKLTRLDLRGNQLQSIGSDVLQILTSISAPNSLKLSENPWKCECDLEPLLKFVKHDQGSIWEKNNIICDKNGRKMKLIELDITDICPIIHKTLPTFVKGIIILSVLMILTLSSLVYFYKNENAIKVWLYANNICIRFITEEELDEDKTFDAFISFSHKDELFVTTELIPQLENGPVPFNLCVHNRDWVIGGSIPYQIMESVQTSRRTIVVVSKNFIKSNWGRSEFYIAHQSSLEEKRLRVIVILYNIELDEIVGVDDTLEAYLKTNTYLKWNDPLFWRKLRYAMPHPSRYMHNQEHTMTSSIDTSAETAV